MLLLLLLLYIFTWQGYSQRVLDSHVGGKFEGEGEKSYGELGA